MAHYMQGIAGVPMYMALTQVPCGLLCYLSCRAMELEILRLQLEKTLAEKEAKVVQLETELSKLKGEMRKAINMKCIDGSVVALDLTNILKNPQMNAFKSKGQYWDELEVIAPHLQTSEFAQLFDELKNMVGMRNISSLVYEKYNSEVEIFECTFGKKTKEILDKIEMPPVRKRKFYDCDNDMIESISHRVLKLKLMPAQKT